MFLEQIWVNLGVEPLDESAKKRKIGPFYIGL